MTGVLRIASLMLIVSAVAGAQQGRVRPTPPAPPAPPPSSTPPTPPPAQAARALFDRDYILDLERLRINADEIRAAAAEAAALATPQAMAIARDGLLQALEAGQVYRYKMGEGLQALERLADGVYGVPGQHVVATPTPLPPGQFNFNWRGFDFGPFDQADPADSLYRSASALLSSGDQRAAAQRFKELQQKFPNSSYVPRAMYFQAFALYRSGTDAELREAVTVLEQFIEKYPSARFSDPNSIPADARALLARIRGNLAERGDAGARQALARTASGEQSCDREDIQVKKEALSALWRLDQTAAAPRFEQVLARRDTCSLELRRYALQILTQRGDDKAVEILLTTARSDPSLQMRADAVNFVARFPNDQVLNALETIARNDSSDALRRSAARSLVGYPSPRARTIVRTIVEDNTMSDNMRCEVLGRFNNERGSADDASWLRTSYPRVTSNRVKACVVRAVVQIGGTDSQRWLMDLSTNEQEPASIRSVAFSSVAANMTVADLGRQYDNAGNRSMRQQVIRMLSQRKEPEAIDKLIAIVKTGSDPTLRTEVLQILSSRGQNDPKVRQMLLDIIDR